MFSYIKGKVVTKTDNMFVLENNGIGYEIIASSNTISNLVYEKETQIYTYMQVKEDGITLFGFSSLEEKDMYLKLISVSGVGGKTAIQILSGANLEDIIKAIMMGDIRFLKGVKGIGKKTAELICVTLREKIADIDLGQNQNITITEAINNQGVVDEACEVLVSLGIKQNEAMKLIRKQYTGTEDLETLVSKCLKNLK
ncbi:MAG: Holliday junction branch migration protein RuvA [Clostridia bacterium]|nr:Holliday junction branch migration protein RuvA [Clostridia bacterium]